MFLFGNKGSVEEEPSLDERARAKREEGDRMDARVEFYRNHFTDWLIKRCECNNHIPVPKIRFHTIPIPGPEFKIPFISSCGRGTLAGDFQPFLIWGEKEVVMGHSLVYRWEHIEDDIQRLELPPPEIGRQSIPYENNSFVAYVKLPEELRWGGGGPRHMFHFQILDYHRKRNKLFTLLDKEILKDFEEYRNLKKELEKYE